MGASSRYSQRTRLPRRVWAGGRALRRSWLNRLAPVGGHRRAAPVPDLGCGAVVVQVTVGDQDQAHVLRLDAGLRGAGDDRGRAAGRPGSIRITPRRPQSR